MDKLSSILMLASTICLVIAIAFLIAGAVGHDLKRVELREKCINLGGIAIKDYYGDVYCLDKNGMKLL